MFSKEHFKLLKIKNIYFSSFGGITTLVRIININPYTTNIISSTDLPEKGILVIEFENNNVNKILVTVIKDFSDINTYTLFHEDPLNEELNERLKKLNELMNTTEQRKELRYEIGLKKWEDFGLTNPETIITDINNCKVRCIINNASIHGVLLTGERSHLIIGDKVIYSCNFEQAINQLCIVINASNCGNGYFRYSLRFLEPLSLIWCNHIIEYGDLLENSIDYV